VGAPRQKSEAKEQAQLHPTQESTAPIFPFEGKIGPEKYVPWPMGQWALGPWAQKRCYYFKKKRDFNIVRNS